MSTIIYGGTLSQIEKQKVCAHEWQGPCLDKISRYFKCSKCFCLIRNCTEAEYYEKCKLEVKSS